jgi:hypothetical protein
MSSWSGEMSNWDLLARKLIDTYHGNEGDGIEEDEFVWFRSPENGVFGFRFMRDYSGKVASENNGGINRQQGLFDIQVRTGNKAWKENQSENYKASHKDCFQALVDCCSEQQCLEVWRGKDPCEIGESWEQKEVLATMALLMFEQEINYVDGKKNPWQYARQSNFKPYVRKPERRRPRDMIMGFVRQCFSLGGNRLDELRYWMRKKPGTVWFFDSKESPWGYSSYPADSKNFFTELERMEGGLPVLSGDVLDLFHEVANEAPDNPKKTVE